MTQIRPGLKLKSAVCTAEVMIIKALAGVELTCGGAALIDAKATAPAGVAADDSQMTGCEIGKRYVNGDQSLEVLCVKPGKGGLAANGAALTLKDAKKLPSSD